VAVQGANATERVSGLTISPSRASIGAAAKRGTSQPPRDGGGGGAAAAPVAPPSGEVGVCVCEQIHFVARRITIPVAKQVGRLTYKLHVHLTT
jgi:hypothetical protein